MSSDYVFDPFLQDARRTERLKPAVIKLLRTVPEAWTEVDLPSLPLDEYRAYFLLTAFGNIERRGWLRFGIINHPACFEVQFQATGAGAFADAVGWAVSRAYNVWSDAWRVWRAANHDDDPYYHDPFRVEAVKPQEMRLLFGKILLAAFSGMRESCLTKHEAIQRYVGALNGKPVHGSARLLQFRESDSTAKAGGEGNRFDWFAVIFKAMLNQHFFEQYSGPTKDDPASSDRPERASQRRRRGRKKADHETARREAELAAAWARARDAGVYKPDFAHDHGMTMRQLDALLDRVAKRNRHSE